MAICEAIRLAVKTATPRRTVKQIASAIGLSDDVLYNVMTGRTRPDINLIDRLRSELSLPKQWPATDPLAELSEGRRVSLAGTPMVPIKVVGSAAAGAGVTNVDNAEDVAWVPERLAQIGGLGWLVDGESMMPALEPGDVAIFREHRVPRRGYPFLIKTPDSAYRVKILDWVQNSWVLRSINPAFPDEPLDNNELLGFLIGWYRMRGSRETLDSDPGGLRLD